MTDRSPCPHPAAVPALATCSYRLWRPEAGLLVRTSLGRPRWFPDGGHHLPSLWEATPRGWYFQAEREEFDQAYLAQLDHYGIEVIAQRLQDIAAEHHAERVVLACFETSPSDCHRGFFADWWESHTNCAVPDLADE